MKEGELEQLIEKYKAGNTTLEEELILFSHAQHSDASMAAWSTFVNNNKVETPKAFNDDLWKSFQHKKTGNRRLVYCLAAVAASILLILVLYMNGQAENEQSYAEKERILNQAKNMFADNTQEDIQYSVFYENEMIRVYTTNE